MSTLTPASENDIWRALDEVMDPEIPVVSVVEMGIVREVELTGEQVTVSMTPTFSGCPALRVMQRDIEGKLRALGFEQVEVRTVLSPPWSSGWITEEARAKLKEFGIAPPQKSGDQGAGIGNVTFYEPTPCPYCDSLDTSVKNTFGPTLCKMIYYCNACQQPFEQFKAL